MTILGASMEPFIKNGVVNVMCIHDGIVEPIPPTEWYNRDRFTPAEMDMLTRLGEEYHWRLPEDLDLNDDLPELPELHGRICRYLQRYVWFSNPDQYDLVAAWIIGTYFRDQFPYSPSLIFDGITNTGKSTMLKCLELVVYRGFLPTSTSAAAIARDIEDFHTTILMDETLDTLMSDRGSDMCALIKSTWEPSKWIRADPKGRRNFIYHTYTSLALSIKGQGLPEDIYNRGIRIGMAGMPDDIILGDIDCIDEDDSSGPSSPREIRRILHELRLITMTRPEGETRRVDFSEYIRTTRQHMTQRCEDGTWMYAYVLDLPKDSPQIRNRNRNIATTLYSIGLATQSERPIIRAILRNDEANKEVMTDTDETLIFVAFLELIKEWAAEHSLQWDRTGFSPAQFRDTVRRISTADIAFRFNNILLEQGNAGRDPVPTRVVTTKLAALGFSYKRGAQRRSWMDANDVVFNRAFLKYTRQYCPEDLPLFEHIADSPEGGEQGV